MDCSLTNAEAQATLLKLISERDQLRMELAYARSTIVELETQNVEFTRLLSNAHAALQACDAKPFVFPSPKRWIGTWHSSPSEYPELAPIEDAWENGRLQHALSQMPAQLERTDLGHRHRINARLLYSALIQSSGDNFNSALLYAEEACQIAMEVNMQELAGKAQFHRGLCYYYLKEYANSRWCFVLCSHLDEHEQTVQECRVKAEQNIEQLPVGDEKRFVSPDFNSFCNF
ncbi:hypothetical protein MMC28_005151 [Mycoblastus sanguinarius]|nr:hypothetical protein [Mycoblastus sanguinarius]